MQNKLQQAIDELQAQLAGREAEIAELTQMVRLQVRAQHWQDAVRWAEQALQRDQRSPECHRLLSEALLGLGMPQEAARRLREAVAMFPKNPALQAQLALVELELDDVNAAWAAMQLPLERELDLPWVHRIHAMVLARLGRLSEACAAMDRAVAGAPNNVAWAEQREALQAQREALATAPASVVPPEAGRPDPALQPQDARETESPAELPTSALLSSEEPVAVTASEPMPPEPLPEELPPAALPEVDAQAAAKGQTVRELPPPQRAAQALPSARMIMVPRRDLRPRSSGGWLSRLWQRLLG